MDILPHGCGIRVVAAGKSFAHLIAVSPKGSLLSLAALRGSLCLQCSSVPLMYLCKNPFTVTLVWDFLFPKFTNPHIWSILENAQLSPLWVFTSAPLSAPSGTLIRWVYMPCNEQVHCKMKTWGALLESYLGFQRGRAWNQTWGSSSMGISAPAQVTCPRGPDFRQARTVIVNIQKAEGSRNQKTKKHLPPRDSHTLIILMHGSETFLQIYMQIFSHTIFMLWKWFTVHSLLQSFFKFTILGRALKNLGKYRSLQSYCTDNRTYSYMVI